MQLPERIGYVVKRYPRYSETFIVNEILAHEAAGFDLGIFALNPPADTHFQNIISRVHAPVTYLTTKSEKISALWTSLQELSAEIPCLWSKLGAAENEEVKEVWQAAMLASEVKCRNITHLHAHFATSAATVTRLAAHFAEVPYTITAHAKDIFHENAETNDLAIKFNNAATVVTISDYNLNYLAERFPEINLKLIHNGLELEHFPFKAPTNRPPRIIAVGRLVEKKGFADLINACAILAKSERKFQCEIIGVGELEKELKNQLESLGLNNVVKMLGPKPQHEVIAKVQEACVLAAPCVIGQDGNRDGLPTVLLEAMALGTPCVSTDVTGIPEVVQHGKTGLQVPQYNPQALAEALGNLLDDAALQVRLATQARTLIEKEFDVEKNASQLREVFASAKVAEEVFA